MLAIASVGRKEYAMTPNKRMRTLIYKRTHSDDPDRNTGVFGNEDCMGPVRGWSFDAVIGVGGIGRESQKNCIAKKLTWVGIGSHKNMKDDLLHPLVTFDHFLYYGENGPLLETLAPELASHIYGKNVRVILDSLSENELLEVDKILDLARNEPSSMKLSGASQRISQETICKHRSKSCHGKSVARKTK